MPATEAHAFGLVVVMSDLIFSDIYRLLSTFSYKPNFQIEFRQSAVLGVVGILHMTMYVPDSRRRHKPVDRVDRLSDFYDFGGRPMLNSVEYRQNLELIPVISSVAVPAYLRNEDELWRWLKCQVQALEKHEADEWFKVNGVPLDDPHKEQNAVR